MAIGGTIPVTGHLKYLVLMKPFSPNQTALRMAASIAKETNAAITAYSCIYLSNKEINHYSSRQEAKHSALEKQRAWISSQLSSTITQGTKTSVATDWNSDWPLAACHHADQIGANLIIQSGSNGSAEQRMLLRFAPCPVLIARTSTRKSKGVILAALDIYSDDDAHRALNFEVVAAAQNLAEETGNKLLLVCAIDEKESIASHLGFEYLSDIEAERTLTAEHYGVTPEQVHIQLGNPQLIITEQLKARDADMLVIGTLARKGITGKLLGNTAEKILLKTHCNLLVVN